MGDTGPRAQVGAGHRLQVGATRFRSATGSDRVGWVTDADPRPGHNGAMSQPDLPASTAQPLQPPGNAAVSRAEVLTLAHALRHTPGCWRLLDVLMRHPGHHFTQADLSSRSGLSDPEGLRPALERLQKLGLVERLEAAGLEFFGLSAARRSQAQAVCAWRARRAHRLARLLELHDPDPADHGQDSAA